MTHEPVTPVDFGHVYAVILAGGSGTRFWPASRKSAPKQLLRLSPETPRSLIGSTFARIEALISPSRIYVATGEHLVAQTREHLPELEDGAFLAEPVPRNTAPCIGWATRIIERRDPNALVFVIPSDQYVTDRASFSAAIELALASAATGAVTTIGITPTRPETGYGYIEVGSSVAGAVSRVKRFVEKPNQATAEAYQASGQFLWNAGMFFFRARDMTQAIRRHLPELAAGLDEIDRAAGAGPARELETVRRVFPTLPAVSIDVGVLEKESNLNVVAANCGWSDLGSFASIWEHSETDPQGNAVPEDTVVVDAHRNLVFSRGNQKRLISLLGVSDLCVVETDDAVLIMPRERAQDVRRVVDCLAAKGRTELL